MHLRRRSTSCMLERAVFSFVSESFLNEISFPEIDTWLKRNDMTRAALLEKVKNELEISCNETMRVPELATGAQTIEKPTTARMKLVRKLIAASQSCVSRLEDELRAYRMEMQPIEDVLEYWKMHENVFPNFASIANVLLSKPAASAKSETAFSVAGSLVRQKRSKIEPTRAEKVLFLHDNYEIFHNI